MDSQRPYISIIAPFYNEEDSVLEFAQRTIKVMDSMDYSWELIMVDDGSKDKSLEKIIECSQLDTRIKGVELFGNYGQTIGIRAGIEQARGEILIPMDGDLQHLPEDIPRFMEKIEEGYDLVSGWREKRVDNLFWRRIPSKVANGAMRWLSGIELHDFGTTFKAYRKDILKNIVLYGQFHRFIPVLTSKFNPKVCEIPITNIERPHGASNYGITRTFTVFFDLIRLKFLTDYLSRPLQVFGTIGFFLISLGGIGLGYLIILKYFYGLGLMVHRPPLFISSFFTILVGFQLFLFGLLAEMISRLYHERQEQKSYLVRQIHTS